MLTGTVTAPAPGTFEWVLPRLASGPTANAITDGAGFTTFQWTPTNPDGDSTIEVVEDPANNPPDPPGGPYENVPDLTECTVRTPDTEDEPLDIDVNPIGGFSAVLPPESIVTCVIVNTAVPAPAITIEKHTNGFDADVAPGPIIPLGDAVSWTYDVTNTGNTTLSSVAITDTVSQPAPGPGPTVSCPSTTLPVGGTMRCTASGTAGAGQYANTAEVDAVDSLGTPVSAADPSHYFGEDSSIQVIKSTEGDDANDPTGPQIAVGDTVDWTYQVTNSGNVPLANVVLTDDNGTPGDPGDDFLPTFDTGDTNGDDLLDPTETWEYSADGAAVAGQYENIATVTGDPPVGTQVRDNDPSHYFGVLSGITIEKFTNGFDADTPTGPVIRVGDPVLWTYLVTNTGNTSISSYAVADDLLGPAICPRPVLVPGSSVLCHLTGTAEEGQYANVGTVTATDILGQPLTDSDPSHYLGIRPELTIEKATNGDDADAPTGPFVPVGGPVTWDYEVTNTGSSTITDLVVLDFRIGGGSIVAGCAPTTLDPGEVATCQATGVAIPGQYANLAVAVGRDQFGELVADLDPSHYFGAESAITLEKYTNGVDADEPSGVLIPVGGVVEWSYVVLNSGNSALSDIELVDDQIGPVACPQDTLAAGAEMTCTATGTAERGQYANIATVTAVDQAETPVSDDDPSHYFGYLIDIDIEKATNGEDADDPTGPAIPVGDPVTWTYVVTNPGDFAIKEVVVTDDQGLSPVFEDGDTNGDGLLDPGETWTYSAAGTAESGQYANVATVDGLATDEGETPVTDSDPSHYIGVDVGSASIGDTVWRDNNRNGVQDAGEPGIQGARVTIDSTTPTIQATAVPVTVLTDADGRYLVSELLAGEYVITIDMSSVSGTLTTPGSVTVDLAIGQTFLDGDFGVAQVVPPPDPEDPDDEIDALPLTGANLDRTAALGLLLILLGGAFLLTSEREDPA